MLLAALPAYGSDATGALGWTCSIAERFRLTLAHVRGLNSEETLVFSLFGNPEIFEQKDWMETSAACVTPRRFCGDIAKSEVQILRVSYRENAIKAISGKFAVEFKDGRKLRGSYSAKGIKPPTGIICE